MAISSDPVIQSFTDYSRLALHAGPLDEKLIAELVVDFRGRIERGLEPQVVDVLGAPLGDKIQVGDGLHRTVALQRLGLPVRVKIQPEPYRKCEVTRLRATTLKRKNARPFELASIATDHKREGGFASWAETAADLDWTEPTMTRIRSVTRIPERLRPATEPLGATVTQLIAKAPTIEGMERAIQFALGSGKPATKDQVEGFIRKLKGEGKPGPKAEPITEIKFPPGSAIVSMKVREKAEVKKLDDEAGALSKLTTKYRDESVGVILEVLKNRSKGRRDDNLSPPSVPAPV